MTWSFYKTSGKKYEITNPGGCSVSCFTLLSKKQITDMTQNYFTEQLNILAF